jgi:hypothetical protein
VFLVVSAIAEGGGKSFVADNNLKWVSKLHAEEGVISICRERFITAGQGAHCMHDGKPGARSSGANLLARLSFPANDLPALPSQIR